MSEKRHWREKVRRMATLFAVKPLMMIYGLQWQLAKPVTTQLWLDRTCLINLGTVINSRKLLKFESCHGDLETVDRNL